VLNLPLPTKSRRDYLSRWQLPRFAAYLSAPKKSETACAFERFIYRHISFSSARFISHQRSSFRVDGATFANITTLTYRDDIV